MSQRVCVFVDGENFRFSICDLFATEFNKADYLPKKARWAALFDKIVDLATDGEGQRLRTYWYVVEYIDFYPYRIPNSATDYLGLLNVLRKDVRIRNEIDGITEASTKRARAIDLGHELYEDQQKMRRRFDGWLQVQNGIAGNEKAIEFRRAGAICYDLFRCRFGKEKAVDVNLATDAVILNDIYDTAIIVSGDQDYTPAVQHIKDFGKRVVNVAFKTRGGVLLPGGARRLNHSTDWSLELSYDDLKSFLGLEPPPASAVPPTTTASTTITPSTPTTTSATLTSSSGLTA